jgi:hypothetical protein
MSAPPARPPEQGPSGAAGRAADSPLLIDRFLPTYDLGVVHAEVFRATPAQCYLVAVQLDLFRTPVIRTLIGVRRLPQRVARTLRRPGATAEVEAPRHTFRFKDMVDLGWIPLDESPGVELVLGQVSRPWKGVAVATQVPTTPEQFSRFDEPGFAKIAATLRVDPRGSNSSILTLETRVAIPDDTSRRRFKRYWLAIGPFSSLIRRMALRELASELRRSTP